MRSFGWRQDALDLVDVVDIVSGDHADDVLDGFLAALGMLAVVLPLIGRKRFEERKVCFAHRCSSMDLRGSRFW